MKETPNDEMEEKQETTNKEAKDTPNDEMEENQETMDIHDVELGDVPSTSFQGKQGDMELAVTNWFKKWIMEWIFFWLFVDQMITFIL